MTAPLGLTPASVTLYETPNKCSAAGNPLVGDSATYQTLHIRMLGSEPAHARNPSQRGQCKISGNAKAGAHDEAKDGDA